MPSSVGPEYLLPWFTGVLLGATTIRPGRVNVWGTVLAVFVLAVTVAGLQQLGASFYVEQLFNGAMLIVAVGLAVYATRRRVRSRSESIPGLDAAARPVRRSRCEQPGRRDRVVSAASSPVVLRPGFTPRPGSPAPPAPRGA